MNYPWATLRILSQQEIAGHTGVPESTVRTYKHRNALPPSTITIGGRDGWAEPVVNAWAATLPGRGHRSDLDEAALLRDRPDSVVIAGVTVELQWNREWHRPSGHQANAWHVERGTCARVRGGSPGWTQEMTDLGQVRETVLGTLPSYLEGIPDDRLGEALRNLALAGAAIRAWRQIRRDRADFTRTTLARLRDQLAAATPADMEHAKSRLLSGVEIALHEGILGEDQIRAAAGVDSSQIAMVRGWIFDAEYAEEASWD